MQTRSAVVTETPGPSYRLVEDDIRARITAGEYPVGSAILSTKKLERQYGVSDTVIKQAVKNLKHAGLLRGQPGKAVYVRAKPEDVAAERASLEGIGDEMTALRQQVAEVRGEVPPGLSDKLEWIVAAIENLYERHGWDILEDGTSERGGSPARPARRAAASQSR
jgi:DNA-binding GntR family transcriptional regulator